MKRAEIRALAVNGQVSHESGPANPLVDALLLVGKLLSRESKGEDVAELLAPALDDLIRLSMKRLASLEAKTGKIYEKQGPEVS
jgi:hypothetical protein